MNEIIYLIRNDNQDKLKSKNNFGLRHKMEYIGKI